VNIFRDPRWGRGQETPGEDPFLTGEYAVAFVRGLQGEAMEGDTAVPEDSKFLKVSGCCKHFSAYSQEVPRHRLDAIVTLQDQADTYLPAFEDCVERGHVSSIMCSYNEVNGVPSCADKALLTDVVRKQWKFDGYITSDCGAIADVIYGHHYTQSPETTCATTLAAGVDLNCGEFLREHLARALEKGVVTKSMVYSALANLFRVQMRLGMYEKGGQPFRNITPDSIDSLEHKALALEAAEQGVVLLKNENNALPLNASAFEKGKNQSLALIGPHFNASGVFLGNYFGIPSSIVTPLEAISKVAGNVTHALGCHVAGDAVPDFDEAVGIASIAHRVIAFVGLDLGQEHEQMDRSHLRLPGFQNALLDRLISVAIKPIVIVVISGGAVDLSSYKDHPKVGAIVLGGYLGQSGGQAIANVLFGIYNPSGRLPQTFYTEDFAQTVSIYDMNMRPTAATGNPGRTYRFYTGSPVFAFGLGLSYSKFEVKWSTTPPPSVLSVTPLSWLLLNGESSCAVEFNVTVLNDGGREGRHSVLCFAEPPHAAAAGQPIKSLVAFELTPVLSVKQQAVLRFCLHRKAFALADTLGEWKIAEGTWVLHIEELRHEIEIQPDRDENGDAVARDVALVE